MAWPLQQTNAGVWVVSTADGTASYCQPRSSFIATNWPDAISAAILAEVGEREEERTTRSAGNIAKKKDGPTDPLAAPPP